MFFTPSLLRMFLIMAFFVSVSQGLLFGDDTFFEFMGRWAFISLFDTAFYFVGRFIEKKVRGIDG